MPFVELTPEIACELLEKAGLRLQPSDVRIEAREERWIAHLPGGRLAWFAASENGQRRLRRERRVLRLLQERCGFMAPRIQHEGDDGEFDVRLMVPGVSDPWGVYKEACTSVALAEQIGRAVGAILAEQHTRIHAADVAHWLPAKPNWPEPAAWIEERLPKVVDDPQLLARTRAVIEMYEAVSVSEADRSLVHGDVGFHNLGIDPRSRVVHGIFDYEDAAWADRHHDFRYLVFDNDRYELLEAALAMYEPIVGREVQFDRVLLYNAACAVTFLAYRAGKRPDERSCGRTLEQDLRWSRHAVTRALEPESRPARRRGARAT